MMKRFFLRVTALAMAVSLLFVSSCGAKPTRYTTDTDQLALPEAGEQIAVMHTVYGDVKFRLFPEDAPKAVENFIALAEKGKYDVNKIFRSEVNYLLQTGDYLNQDGTGNQSARGGTFGTEVSDSLHNLRGALGMARSESYNTCGSQYYVVTRSYVSVAYTEELKKTDPALAEQYETTGGIPELDGEYTVFGQAFEGLDVLDKLNAVEVDDNNCPVEDLYVMSVEIITMGETDGHS